MKAVSKVVFLQKRCHRAGAQTSLARMLGSRTLSHIDPIVVLGEKGWLAEELSGRGIGNFSIPFPSPRALKSRVFGLESFSRKTRQQLVSQGIYPVAVFANDHQECPLALALSKESGNIPVITLLRTPGMSERDFQKYRCGESDALLCEGKELQERVLLWTAKETALFEEGFTDDEFQSGRDLPEYFPDRILVIGSEDPRKGFVDFIEALDWIETNRPDFPPLHCDFTGLAPDSGGALLDRKRRATFHFLGRIDDYASRVRDYSLAVHPSRAETFGMAPIEAILAGTPTIVSSTGIVGERELLAPWRFPPGDTLTLAETLLRVWETWPNCCVGLREIQESLHDAFHIDQTTKSVKVAFASCGIN